MHGSVCARLHIVIRAHASVQQHVASGSHARIYAPQVPEKNRHGQMYARAHMRTQERAHAHAHTRKHARNLTGTLAIVVGDTGPCADTDGQKLDATQALQKVWQ